MKPIEALRTPEARFQTAGTAEASVRGHLSIPSTNSNRRTCRANESAVASRIRSICSSVGAGAQASMALDICSPLAYLCQAMTRGFKISSHHCRKLVGVVDCGVRGSAVSSPRP